MKKTFFLLGFLFSLSLWSSTLEVGAEWLYWEAEQSQMLFFAEVQLVDNQVTSTPLFPKVHYNNGYRVFADWTIGQCWHLNANLAHLPQRATISRDLDPSNPAHFLVPDAFLYPIFQAVLSSGGSSLNYSNVVWSLNLYDAALAISRSFLPSKCLNIEPYFGLRGFWMNQKINVDAISPGIGAGVFLFDAKFRERDRGVGLLAGCDFGCRLGWGFSLVGQFGSALVYTRERLGQSLSMTLAEAPAVRIDALNMKVYRLIPIVDSYLGLEYSRCICCHQVECHVGWENHFFFHTNQFSLTQDGNLTTQGLTLGTSIQF